MSRTGCKRMTRLFGIIVGHVFTVLIKTIIKPALTL